MMMRQRQFRRCAMERFHERCASVTSFGDDAKFVAPQHVSKQAVLGNTNAFQAADKGLLSLQEMDIRVPQGVVGVKDKIETSRSRRKGHQSSLAVRLAAGNRNDCSESRGTNR